jgi:hypothetical protein
MSSKDKSNDMTEFLSERDQFRNGSFHQITREISREASRQNRSLERITVPKSYEEQCTFITHQSQKKSLDGYQKSNKLLMTLDNDGYMQSTQNINSRVTFDGTGNQGSLRVNGEHIGQEKPETASPYQNL